ncbi:MAG: response regulator transcription factor [Symbiobacteriaceae bacterium]|nr:response regulator transcription factor [Symbiobacteriaceae bacterium]
MHTVLVVDDDQHIRELLHLYLSKEGYMVIHAADGDEAIALALQHKPALILLDIMLPGRSGFQVCQELRERLTTPIIMISAKGEEIDKVTGLDLGADDYIAKPFSPREVVARVKAVLRRMAERDSGSQEEIRRGNLYLNLTQWIVQVEGHIITLTPKETELLWHLARHANRLFTREQLLQSVWGYEYFGDARTVDVHIKRVRQKLSVVPAVGWSIRTIWGEGYKFEVQ